MKSCKSILILLFGLCVISLFSACQERPRPSPDQTMIGDEAYESGYLGDAATRPADRAGMAEDLTSSQFLEDFGGMQLDPILEQREPFGNGERVRGLFESVYFEFDRSNIRPGERSKIEQVAEHLRQNPNQNILLEGHCDWRGTTEYNLGLGDRRASSVSEYLQNLGIPRSRIEVLSMGDLEAAVGGTEAQMAEDRRVEFVILQ